MRYQKKVLQNGLTVIEAPSSEAESCVVDFFVKTGSRSEAPKESGISHFLEHFLFKGTKKYPSAMAISELVDSIGGEMNANTGKEHTQYFIKAASKHLGLIFEVLSDMLQNPLLDKEELAREKGVIVEEINMYKDTPTYDIENVLEGAMWPKQPLGRDIAGTPQTVAKFNRAMFEKYLAAHYQAPNMILGVSGKYDSKKFWQLIRLHWQNLNSRPYRGWAAAQDRQSQARLSLKFKDTQQAHLAFGFKGFAYSDPRNAAAAVLSAVLGGGMSSRLFTEVRERRGLAYYVRAGNGNYQDTGTFNVSSGVQVNKIQEAIEVILAELAKIQNQIVGAKELNKAKEYIKGKTTLALEDNQARLDWFLERCAFYRKIKTPGEVFKEIDGVSAAELAAAAKTLFRRRNLTLAIIGPYKNGKPFEKLLNWR